VADARRVVPKGDGTGCSPAIEPRDALKDVVKEFSVGEKDLRGRSTAAKVSWARDELCCRLRDLGFTYAEIGAFLGGRTHSAIIAAVKRARSRVDMS
jgi:chromosomal replication initiation ATPase DnaA